MSYPKEQQNSNVLKIKDIMLFIKKAGIEYDILLKNIEKDKIDAQTENDENFYDLCIEKENTILECRSIFYKLTSNIAKLEPIILKKEKGEN